MLQNKKFALLISDKEPNEEQKEKIIAFLEKKYGVSNLKFRLDESVKGGFKLSVSGDVYDWTNEGRLRQLHSALSALSEQADVMPLLRETVSKWQPKAIAEEIGTVISVGDGIAAVSGLPGAQYGEILEFEGGIKGLVQDLKENEIGCILFDSEGTVSQGSTVKRTGSEAGIPVGEKFIGRVINALGEPVDGLGKIEAESYNPIEKHAPGIIDRQPVNTPLETGILAIDSMFPIGRGQRELIIGDRQTGKTAIAVDTILNQKGKNVICIYVSVGQKASTVANLTSTLKKYGAMDYTIVVNSTAADPAPLQYLAPYAGCAIGEYFMAKGKDVLIVYDDLSKHAVAYRELSLLLGRTPGREAYPGDIFYLHSRLLERSAHLSDELGGGSLTALPIVETQLGDVSAYIPTNVISITDGQIFLESDLFFSGQRPAVNVGLSVSRVGGDAQAKIVKKSSGTLRLDLAQYREMAVFTQFAGDLDASTAALLEYGKGLMQMLRQKQHAPISRHRQVIILNTALNRLLCGKDENEIPVYLNAVCEKAEAELSDICKKIDTTGILTEAETAQIVALAACAEK